MKIIVCLETGDIQIQKFDIESVQKDDMAIHTLLIMALEYRRTELLDIDPTVARTADEFLAGIAINAWKEVGFSFTKIVYNDKDTIEIEYKKK